VTADIVTSTDLDQALREEAADAVRADVASVTAKLVSAVTIRARKQQ
jgi:hypothetical protein